MLVSGGLSTNYNNYKQGTTMKVGQAIMCRLVPENIGLFHTPTPTEGIGNSRGVGVLKCQKHLQESMKLKIIGISRWVGEGVFEKIPLVGKRYGYFLELHVHNIKYDGFNIKS